MSSDLPWVSASQRPGEFYDGDRYLVAVPLHADSGGGYDADVVCVNCDEGRFTLTNPNGDYWGWDWADVSHYILISGKEPQ